MPLDSKGWSHPVDGRTIRRRCRSKEDEGRECFPALGPCQRDFKGREIDVFSVESSRDQLVR
jgi:hypothetical protein